MLQEAALADNDAKAQPRLLRAAEQVAETSSMLFELEHEKKSAFDSLTSAVRARDHLRAALSALQAPEMAGRFPAECADIVASALAIIFSAAKGSDWQDREALRRARKRALLMRVPHDDAPASSSASTLAASRPPEAESVPPIPLSRRRAPAPAAPSSAGPVSQPQSSPKSERAVDPRKWNRRVTGRSVLEVDVGLVSESQFYAGLSMDLSTGGLFVATYQSKPVGTRVAVSLVLPGGQSVWAKGVVRWVREASGEDDVPGMGVEFTEIEPADLEAIKHFCKMRAPMYFESDEPAKR
jgi:uncharacterized protein (TIGR02266 family)